MRSALLNGLGATLFILSTHLAPVAAQEGPSNATIDLARKEGEVIVWGQAGEFRRAFWKDAFEKRFPGVSVRLFQASSNSERDSRFVKEFEAGVAKVDLLVGGTGGMIGRLKPAGMLQPLRPFIQPEILEAKNWAGGKQIWGDDDKQWTLISDMTPAVTAAVNKSVTDSDLKSWTDLLNPKFDGKIIMGDPRQAGQAFAIGLFMYYNPDLGPDFVSKLFAKGRVTFTADERQSVEWVDSGRMLINIYPRTVEVNALQKVGGTLRPVVALEAGGRLQSLSVGSDGAVTVPNLSPLPHPNAARLYINWLYSKEGQQAMVDIAKFSSTRVDVDQSQLSPLAKPAAGVNYTSMNDEVFIAPEKARAMRDAITRAIAGN